MPCNQEEIRNNATGLCETKPTPVTPPPCLEEGQVYSNTTQKCEIVPCNQEEIRNNATGLCETKPTPVTPPPCLEEGQVYSNTTQKCEIVPCNQEEIRNNATGLCETKPTPVTPPPCLEEGQVYSNTTQKCEIVPCNQEEIRNNATGLCETKPTPVTPPPCLEEGQVYSNTTDTCLSEVSNLVVFVNVINSYKGTKVSKDFNYIVSLDNNSKSTVFPGSNNGTVHILPPGNVSVEVLGSVSSSIEIEDQDPKDKGYTLKKYDSCPAGSANPEEGCLLEGYQCGPDGCGNYSDGACDDCSPSLSFSVNNGCANINLEEGETKTCTITLEDKPSNLVIILDVNNPYGGTKTAEDFGYSVTSNGNPPSAVKKKSSTTYEYTLNPGYVSVKMNGKAGPYTLDVPPNQIYGVNNHCTNTILKGGETKTCTIKLEQKPAIFRVILDVKNPYGGPKKPGDFKYNLKTNGKSAGTFTGAFFGPLTYHELKPGTIVSVDLKGMKGSSVDSFLYSYKVSMDKCPEVSLMGGKTKTCTIKLEEKPAKLRVVVDVKNDERGQKLDARYFDYSVTGNDKPPTNVKKKSSTTYEYTLKPGKAWVKMKKAVEIAPSLYSVDIDRYYSYIVKMGNCEDVNLKGGETKTCTISANDKLLFDEDKEHIVGGYMEGWAEVDVNGNVDTYIYSKAASVVNGFRGAFSLDFIDSNGKSIETWNDKTLGVPKTECHPHRFWQCTVYIDRDDTFTHSVSKEIMDRTAEIKLDFYHKPKKYGLGLSFVLDNKCQPPIPVGGLQIQVCGKAGYKNGFFAKIYDVKVYGISLKEIDVSGNPLDFNGKVQSVFTLEDVAESLGGVSIEPFKSFIGIKPGDSVGDITFEGEVGGKLTATLTKINDNKLVLYGGVKITTCILWPDPAKAMKVANALNTPNINKAFKGLLNNKYFQDFPKVISALMADKNAINYLREMPYPSPQYSDALKSLEKSNPNLYKILKDSRYTALIDIYMNPTYSKLGDLLLDKNYKNTITKLFEDAGAGDLTEIIQGLLIGKKCDQQFPKGNGDDHVRLTVYLNKLPKPDTYRGFS